MDNNNELNNGMAKINNWAFQWKMNFNAYLSKQVQEVIFSQKWKKISHPPLLFNNIQVLQSFSQKHLGIILAEQLTFFENLKILTSKINKTIGLLRKLQNPLPRSVLITIYKAFVRPHLDYCDIISDEGYNTSFHHKLELFQYNACLAITGAIRDTSKKKALPKIKFGVPSASTLIQKTIFFLQDFKNNQPSYLSNIVPQQNFAFNTKKVGKVPLFKIKHNFLKNTFFPSTVIEWNKLDPHLWNKTNFQIFQKNILLFIRPTLNSFFNCRNPKGTKLITRLCTDLSFQESLNPICRCGTDVESCVNFSSMSPISKRKTYPLEHC